MSYQRRTKDELAARVAQVVAQGRKTLTEMESKALLAAFRFPFKN